MTYLSVDKLKITFNNGFTKIVERNNIKNFNALLDWMDKFNSNQYVSLLTVSGFELGSSISLDKNNIKSIEIID